MRHFELLVALAWAWTRTTSTAFFSHLELNRNLFSFFQSALAVITSESAAILFSVLICSIFLNLEVEGLKIGSFT